MKDRIFVHEGLKVLKSKTHGYGVYTTQPIRKGDIIEAEVIDIKILARTGFKNRAKGYTTAKKNEQIRDSVTGAYV